MSRAKAKLAILHDLQSREPDWILTKKDCDMIADALYKTYEFPKISRLYFHLKRLSRL